MRRPVAIALAVVGGIIALAILSRGLGLLLRERQAESEDPGDAPTYDGSVDPSVRLAGARFVDVGTSLSIRELGILKNVASVEPSEGVLSHDAAAHTVKCERGGTGYVTAAYRPDSADKNRVQTQLIICVDETGSCSGLPRVAFDLERHLDRTPKGEANYLAQGSGDLYGVCRDGERIRVQAGPELPPLMFRIIDAFGQGVYSLGDKEFDLIRRSPLITRTGTEIRPPWATTISLEMTSLTINPNGTIGYAASDCDASPACTYNADVVRAGDLLTLGFGFPTNMGLQGVLDAAGASAVDAFVASHVDVDWDATAHLEQNARNVIVYRLIGLEAMEESLRTYEGHYGLKAKGIQIAYDPNWQTRYRIPALCLPDQRDECLAIEDKLDVYERQRIAAWRADGFDLWHHSHLAVEENGAYRPIDDVAPSFDAFAGVSLGLSSSGRLKGPAFGPAVADAMSDVAAEIGNRPVYLIHYTSPMRFALDGTFCEADVCTSAFSDLFTTWEGAIRNIPSAFAAGQVQGFGLSLIDGGSHFDIREPYELRGGFWLNRVGETGYNNPFLNLYLTR